MRAVNKCPALIVTHGVKTQSVTQESDLSRSSQKKRQNLSTANIQSHINYHEDIHLHTNFDQEASS